MKFVVSSLTKCKPRLGSIVDITRLPDTVLETPMCMLYTRGGSIPHITHEVLQIVSKEPQAIQVPLVSTNHFHEPLMSWGRSIGEFVGLGDCVTCVTVQDPGDYTPQGHHQQESVPIWTKSGKIYMNSETYMNIIESFKPDMYCVLSDGDTNRTSSKKRISKAVDGTLKEFKKCMERHNNSKVLQNSMVIAAIEGGYCLEARQRCISALLENGNIGGYLIDGLHNNGPEVEMIPFEEIEPVVKHDINLLPPEKVRFVHSCWNPVSIIKLVKLGVDVFDTSYPHLVTERSGALTFLFDPFPDGILVSYEINMRDPIYSHDFRPLMDTCKCLTCTKHSRAYLHHLHNVQELLGSVLLTIHNVHHYLEFFRRIREAIESNTLDVLEETITKQYNDHQNSPMKEKRMGFQVRTR